MAAVQGAYPAQGQQKQGGRSCLEACLACAVRLAYSLPALSSALYISCHTIVQTVASLLRALSWYLQPAVSLVSKSLLAEGALRKLAQCPGTGARNQRCPIDIAGTCREGALRVLVCFHACPSGSTSLRS